MLIKLTPINGISKFTKLFSARKTQKIISNLLKHFPGIFMPVLILLFLAMLLGCGGNGPINDATTTATGGTGLVSGSIILSLTKLSDNSPTISVSVDSPAKLTVIAAVNFKGCDFSWQSSIQF